MQQVQLKRVFLIFLAIFLLLFLPANSYFKKKVSIEDKQLLKNIKETILPIIENYPGKVSLVWQSLSDKRIKYSFKGEEKYPAASLIKVPVMVYLLDQAAKGKIFLNDQVTLTAKDICPGSGILKNYKMPRKISIYKLLELMITRSDNSAANKIISLLGKEKINEFLRQIGLTQTQINRYILEEPARRRGIENFISCEDLSIIFSKIYNKKLVSPWYSQLMLHLLFSQKVNDRLPRYLPEYVMVAHKTGLVSNSVGDAGIISSPQGDYFLCVITKDFNNYGEAKNIIARISEAIYQAWQKNKK